MRIEGKMLILSVSNLSKSYIEENLFNDLSFSIYSGDKIGIIGENGSGKTTILNILSNKITPDSGEIYVSKNTKISVLEQNISYTSEYNVYEECLSIFNEIIELEKEIRNIENEMGKKELDSGELEKLFDIYEIKKNKFEDGGGYSYESKIRGILNGLGFSQEDFYKPVNFLSGGQKTRLHLAKLLLRPGDLLLLDEPTNHLDLSSIEFLESYLKDYKGSIFLISHDRFFLNSICNKIFDFSNKKIEIYNCKYEEYIKRKEKNYLSLKKSYENQQKEIKRQTEIIQRFENYGNRRFIKQASARRKNLEKISVIEDPEIRKNLINLKLIPETETGRDVLKIENLSMNFEENYLFDDINLNIYKGDRIGLIGNNGVGKTTLFKIIFGEIKPKMGKTILGSRVKIGYFDQEQKTLNEKKTVIDEFWDAYPKLNYYDVRSYLAKFSFYEEDINKLVSNLSGGERARLELLKLMLSNSNFLILDEPTNHLDIDSKEILENAILDYTGTVFVISHDRYFLNKIVNKIWELNNKKITEYYGNYDYYIEKINESKEVENQKIINKTVLEKEKRKNRELEKEKKKLNKIVKDIEMEILEIESEIEQINEDIQKPENYENTETMGDFYSRLSYLTDKKEKLYLEWEKYI